jgi:hypothetical protein
MSIKLICPEIMARSKDRLSIGGYAMNSVKRGHVSHKWPSIYCRYQPAMSDELERVFILWGSEDDLMVKGKTREHSY